MSSSFKLLASLGLSFLTVSCATIINSTKQSVTFTADQPNAEITIDRDITVRSGESVRIKRNKDHRIHVEADGYAPIEYNVLRRKNNAHLLNWISAVPMFLIGNQLANQEEENVFGDIEPKQPQAAIGQVMFYGCWAPFGLATIADVALGGAYKFPSEFNFELPYEVWEVNPEEAAAVRVGAIYMEFEPGTKIGTAYRSNGKEIKSITWSEMETMTIKGIDEKAIDHLVDAGVNVTGHRNKMEEMIEEGRESFILEAEIIEISLDLHMVDAEVLYMGDDTYEYSSTMRVAWRFINPKNKEVIKEISTRGKAVHSDNDEGIEAIYKAFRYNFNALTHDPTYQDLVQTRSIASGGANAELDDISALADIDISYGERGSKLTFVELAAQSMKAAVTVINNSYHGSGFFISSDGYVLTSSNVVHLFRDIEVRVGEEEELIPAQVVYDDPDLDLAVIKVEGEGYPYLKLAKELPGLGDNVMVVGTPAFEDLSQTISRGVVSGQREIDEVELIQTDARISPGLSGGPMIDMYGNVVGIVTMKVVSDGVESLGFGVPVTTLSKAIESSK